MRSTSSVFRNLLSAFGIGAMLSLAICFPPEPAVKEAYLGCPGAEAKQFTDMQACSTEMKGQAGCSCSRPPSQWSSIFWRLVPVVIGLSAAILLDAGPIMAVAIIAITTVLFGSLTLISLTVLDRLDAEGLYFSLFALAPLAVITMVAYGVARAARHFWRRHTRTT